MRSSYSQNSLYQNCPKAWYHQYIEKWASDVEGSSLYFGTAMDRGVTAMLDGDPDWLKKFYDNWEFSVKEGKGTRVFDSPNITYSHKDFDADLLEDKDYLELDKWAKELNLIGPTTALTNKQLVELYKQCSKAKGNPYIKITPEQFKYFNRCSWIGLKRKGKVLLKAFEEQVKPNITKVISTQKRSKIVDPNTGDEIIGYVDMILELKNYNKPIIFDLKTSAFPYEQHQIDTSPQLTMYAAMEAHNHNTNLVGYIILPKNVQKDVVGTCQKCQGNKNTRHQTCNSLDASGNRCNGAWTETRVPKPEVQIMIAEKSQEQINDLLVDTGNIILAMKNSIIYKNTDKCENFFGNRCPYYGLCHRNGDSTGLKQRK